MSATAISLITPRTTVKTAYDCLDAIFTVCSVRDLTDGIYTNEQTDYEAAQHTQRQWLLDQTGCTAGMRLLDIGCGYGTLLAQAEERGATAVGITLSPKQAKWCRRLGLTVEVMDYRDVSDSWHGQFDCIVANGSAEHFVQPLDAVVGRQDDIYREFFAICHDLLSPSSPAKRLATTVIHFDRVRPRPDELLESPWRFPWGSDSFHSAMLARVLGGFYPADGQLEHCAAPHFALMQAVDGTEDYRRTSEEWLRMIRRSFLHPGRLAAMLAKLMPCVFTSPRQMVLALGLLVTESWQWQFRGAHPPAKLWRHVWQAT